MTNEPTKCCEKCDRDATCMWPSCPCHSAQQEVCQSGPLCSHNRNGRDLDKPCSVSFPFHQPQPAPKEQEWEKEFLEWSDGVRKTTKIYNGETFCAVCGTDPELMISRIRTLLTHHTDKARREEFERYTVSWDIADGGKNWEVQFWRKESDGTLTCVTRLNKESDDGGSFSLSTLTHPVETKEEK